MYFIVINTHSIFVGTFSETQCRAPNNVRFIGASPASGAFHLRKPPAIRKPAAGEKKGVFLVAYKKVPLSCTDLSKGGGAFLGGIPLIRSWWCRNRGAVDGRLFSAHQRRFVKANLLYFVLKPVFFTAYGGLYKFTNLLCTRIL